MNEKKGTLATGCGTKRVTELEVRNEPKPEFTATWSPYSHAEVLDSIGSACTQLNIEIVRKEYSIRKNSKMFGVWEVSLGHQKVNFAIGIRNSIDKTHSVGLCAGERVFVCDNLVFSGDFVLFRKHTSKLELMDLTTLAKESLELLYFKFEELQIWHESLRKIKLTSEQASLLIFAAMRKEIIPPSKLKDFDQLFFHPKSIYDLSLHGFHGAATELMKDLNLLTINWKNDMLNRFINHEAPLLLKGTKKAEKVVFSTIEDQAKKDHLVKRETEKAAAREQSKEIKAKIDREKKEREKKSKQKTKKEQISTGKRISVEKSKTSKKSSQRNAQGRIRAKNIKIVESTVAKSKTAHIKHSKLTTAKQQPQKQQKIKVEKAEKTAKNTGKKGHIIDDSDIKTPAVKLIKCHECGALVLLKSKVCATCGAKQFA